MRVEILIERQMSKSGKRILEAMIAASPFPVETRTYYRGRCDLLMTYGTGHPIRRPWWQQHRARGKHCIGWDLGYWRNAAGDERRMRLTLDDDHPQKWIRPEPATRWERDGLTLREDANPDGPILLIGLSQKANVAHNLKPLEWENRALEQIRDAHPRRAVVFRPKRDSMQVIPGLPIARGTIEDALIGTSLVVCRHSNVAVDACVAGVPVVCQDGAAAALYGPRIDKPRAVTVEERLAFLQSLAWWQYDPSEAKTAWNYILARLSA